MKQKFKLTHDELLAIMAAFEQKANPEPLWQGVCLRLGVAYSSVEDAKSGDPHDFLAEPVAAAPENPKDRGQWTSASNAQADTLCPGRHQAQLSIPETPRGEDALMGSRIHAALAVDGETLAKLTLEERESFDACREVEKKLVAQYLGDVAYKVQRHERFWARWPNAGRDFAHSGEADVVFRFGTKALILDYKVLAGDVAESPKNMQLRDLAVLVKANTLLLEEIAVAIVQPLVTHSPELCVYTNADLERALTEMMARVERSNDPKSPRVAGEVQCKFCRAKKVCVEFSRWAGSTLPVVIEPVKQVLVFQVAMDLWSPEERALAASIIPLATKRLDEIKEHLKGLLTADPSSIPGWQLKPGAVRETITDAQQCFDRFATEGGHLPEFFPCIKVEKGKLKEALAKVTNSKGKALKVKLDALLEGITESNQNSPSLERMGA